MTAAEIFSTKLTSAGITLSNDEQVLIIEEVEQVVLNYCNLESVPEELRFTVANMSMDLTRYQESLKPTNTDTIDVNDVDSLKIGDTNIKLGGKGSKESQSHQLTVDDVVMNYKSQLNKFRRMVW